MWAHIYKCLYLCPYVYQKTTLNFYHKVEEKSHKNAKIGIKKQLGTAPLNDVV